MEIPAEIDGMKVTEIGDRAFYYAYELTEVTIPDGVTKIGLLAFCGCAFTEIEIPENVTEIGERVFSGCSSLTAINVSENNKHFASVDGVLFNKDISLLISYPEGKEVKTYVIPDSVTEISGYAFSNAAFLDKVEIHDSVSKIGDFAFYGGLLTLSAINVSENNKYYTSDDGVLFDKDMTTLICYPAGKGRKTYAIPDGVTNIYEMAFAYCKALTKVEIPDSMTKIGYTAFGFCPSLTEVNIPDSVTEIGRSAFYGCSTLTKVNIPDGVIKIANYTFYNCRSLTKINIPDSVTSIEESAFQNCRALTIVEIPDSVSRISSNAFSGCTALETVIFDESIPYSYSETRIYSGMYSGAFDNCPSLTFFGYTGSVSEKYADDNSFPFVSIDCTAEDKATGIKVLHDEPASDMAELSVKERYYTNGSGYEIHLTYNGETVELENDVIVKIPVPEDWDADSIKLYYQNTYSSPINYCIADGYITFRSDSLGEYIIVSEEEVKRPEIIEDKDTGVQVTDSEDALPADAELKVVLDEENSSDDKVSYDITVTVNGDPAEIYGSVTVTIPIPEKLKGAEEYFVFYKDKDGKLTDLQATYDKDKNCVTFTTDHFSEYILAVKNLTATIRGDVNNSGGLTNDDLILLAQYLAKWDVQLNMEAANVDGDPKGNVNNDDLIMLAQLLAGWKV